MEVRSVTFIPVSRACPICNQWIDCATHVHAAKHGLTRDKFIRLFERYQVTIDPTYMVVTPRIPKETNQDYVRRHLLQGEGKFTLRYLSDKLCITIGTVRRTFYQMDRSIFDVGIRTVPILGLHNGTNATYRESVYFRRDLDELSML